LLNPKGYCLYDSTCTNITIPLVINSFYPTSVNVIGGAEVFVNTSGLPSIDKNNI